jgi:RNA polymerase primary sigma factor
MESKLQDRLGRRPTEEEVANTMKASPKRVEHLKSAMAVWSTQGPAEGDSDFALLDELVVDPRSSNPETELIQNDKLEKLHSLLDSMEYRDRSILQRRFGIGCTQPKTLKEIGDELGISRERVRQLADQAINRLTCAMHAD